MALAVIVQAQIKVKHVQVVSLVKGECAKLDVSLDRYFVIINALSQALIPLSVVLVAIVQVQIKAKHAQAVNHAKGGFARQDVYQDRCFVMVNV